MLDWKEGYRHVGSISLLETELINVLVKKGYRLFVDPSDLFKVEIYFKHKEAFCGQ